MFAYRLTTLLICLAAFGQAQEALQSSYVGLQLGGVFSAAGPAPFAELQVGGPVAENVELRAAGLPLVLVNVLQLDLLYTWGLSEALRGYVGGGPDVLALAFTDGPAFGVHGTAGGALGLLPLRRSAARLPRQRSLQRFRHLFRQAQLGRQPALLARRLYLPACSEETRCSPSV